MRRPSNPPNPARGYYVNVYLIERQQNIVPSQATAVHTDPYNLPYVTLIVDVDCCDSDSVYHEGFHVFQWAGSQMTPGFDYRGSSMGWVHLKPLCIR